MDVVLVTVALLAAFGVVLWWSRRETGRMPVWTAPHSMHAAARRGAVGALEELLAAGCDVHALDADGNTALHLAYFENRPEAVAWLVEHGADPRVRNRRGFMPPEMRRFGEVVRLLRRGADALTPAGTVHKPLGTSLPDELRAVPADMYLAAVERLATIDPARRRVVLLVIKLGVPGTESLLCDLLWRDGDRSTAEVYLNSGSPELRACALEWAAAGGYEMVDSTGHRHVTWGDL